MGRSKPAGRGGRLANRTSCRGHIERLEDRLLLSVTMTVREQLLLYLVNRARFDPEAEAARYGIDLNEGLEPGTISPETKPPLAPHQSLVDAARAHSADMLAKDFFGHTNLEGQSPSVRAAAAGYPTSMVGENIGWGGTTGTLDVDTAVYERHESLFRSSGHRENMLNPDYLETGAGVKFGEFQSYNASMVSELFGIRKAGPFLTGVAFSDYNRNGLYDLDEGIPGVTITVGAMNMTTNEGGGWSIEVTPGSYAVTASGGGFDALAAAPVTVESDNVQVDFISGLGWGIVNFNLAPPPPTALDDRYGAAEGFVLIVPAATGVLANDLDPQSDPLTAVLVQRPSHGTVNLGPDGSFNYAPQADFSGTDYFTYKAHDGRADSNEATVTLRVVEHLGAIDFLTQSNVKPSDGELRYRFAASRDGILTAQLTAGKFGPDTQITLYGDSGSGEFQQLQQGQTRLDYDRAGSGRQYALRVVGLQSDVELVLANMVQTSPDRSRVTVFGTRRDDTLEAVAGSSQGMTVNGVRYQFEEASDLQFLGGGGSDSAVLIGTDGDESATLFPSSATVAGPAYRVELAEVESISLDGGGGNDSLRLYDSSGHDTLVAAPGYASLSGIGFSHRATSFQEIYAYATEGGSDTAKLFDSRGDDRFVAAPGYGALSGEGFSIRAESFDAVHAFATAGGYDVTRMYDSTGNDSFYASPLEAALYGNGFYNRAKHFEAVHGYATAGGIDEAMLYDSPGNDSLYASPAETALYGEGFYNRGKHFENVYAFATAGGFDEAALYDSAGNDLFVSAPTYAAMYGEGFYNRAMYFDVSYALATAGGFDVAKMFDSPGNDHFVAAPTYGAFYGEGFYSRAMHFDGVHAYATAGGVDTAELFDSTGDDVFYADPVSGALYGTGYFNRAKHFERVYADASAGGRDEAYLHDSALVDLLEADGNWVRLSNAALDFLYHAAAFEQVTASATTPGDTKSLSESSLLDLTLALEGPWQDA